MELLFELMRSAVFLFFSPLYLIKAACLLGVRTGCLAMLIGIQAMKFFVNCLADLCWKAIIWSLACISFPVRVLTAVQRENMLEIKIYNLRIEMDNLIWENKQLEEKLQLAIRDRKVIETVFAEVEDEYDKAVTQIEQLENELQELKADNRRLKEIQGKSLWDHKSGHKEFENVHEGIPVGTKYALPPTWSADYDHGGAILHGGYDHGLSWGNRKSGSSKLQDAITRSMSAASGGYPYPQASSDVSVFDQRRSAAISQSVFSALLSLLVGAIIWEADDPCMPLVAALFIVVGMSLSSVVQFFSTIKNKPASDAVALLSLNWFVLGTLTSPALPRIARLLAPPALRLSSRALGWIGLPQ